MSLGSLASILSKFRSGPIKEKESISSTFSSDQGQPPSGSGDSPERHFLNAESILSRPQCAFYVSRIKEIAGLSDAYFDTFYQPVLNRFAVLCQDVGASSNHHHSYPFGLIEHSLEVAMYAMRKSQGCVYFPDGHIETIQWLERVFMYSVFCAALLHDGGKIYTNFKWYIRGHDGDWKLWNPLIQTVPNEDDRVPYRVTPFQNKSGKNVYLQTSHELFAANLLLEVVPTEGIEWIIAYSEEHCSELFIHFIHTLASDYSNGGDIGACVKQADQKSTNESIKKMQSSATGGGAYIDLSDPNVSLPDSFQSVFRKMFADPNAYNLTVNAVAMGKFSHLERFGDLLFVSAKSVVPIVTRILKENAVRIPNEQSIYTLLIDNGIALPALSGDTLWWCEFFSRKNNNKSKEIAYLVFDLANYPDVAIKDLRDVGVEISIATKTLGQDVPVKDTIEETLSGHPSLLEKLFSGIETSSSSPASVSSNDTLDQRPLPENGSAPSLHVSQEAVFESGEDNTAPIHDDNAMIVLSESDGQSGLIDDSTDDSVTPSSIKASLSPSHAIDSGQKGNGIIAPSPNPQPASIPRETTGEKRGLQPPKKSAPTDNARVQPPEATAKRSASSNTDNTSGKKPSSRGKKPQPSNNRSISSGINTALGLGGDVPSSATKRAKTDDSRKQQGKQAKQGGTNNQQGKQAKQGDANNQQGKQAKQGGTNNQQGKQAKQGGTNTQHGQQTKQGGTNNQHGQRTKQGGTNNQHGQQTKQGGTNNQHGQQTKQGDANNQQGKQTKQSGTNNQQGKQTKQSGTNNQHEQQDKQSDTNNQRGQQPVAKIPNDPDHSTWDDSPFKAPKIKEKPEPVTWDADEIEKACDQMPLNVPAGFSLFDAPDAKAKTRLLVSTWLPYLSDLLTKELITANDDKAAIFHLREGMFIVKEPLEELLADELVRDLFSCVTQSTWTIVGRSTRVSVKLSSGLQLHGYLLGTRRIKKEGKPLPFMNGATIVKEQ